jgi:transcription antitermination factor NusG
MDLMHENIDVGDLCVADSEACASTETRGRVLHAENSDKNIKFRHGGNRPGAGRPAGSLNAKPAQGRKPLPEIAYEASLGLRWYVVDTHPGAERQAIHDLARQGWRAYLPLIAVRKRDPVLHNVFRKDIVPMFRGFLFVEFDREGSTWGCIRNCTGVRNIIRGAGGRPSPVPQAFVPALMQGDAERLELTSALNEPRKIGRRVRVNVGPMATFEGMVLACDGVVTMVSVEMFGRTMPVQLAWAQVADLAE